MSNRRLTRISILLPALYLLICGAVWISFVFTNHDGLANMGLALITLPSSAIERALTYQIYGSFDNLPLWEPLLKQIGLPSGYLWNHAFWFVPLAGLQAYFLFLMGRFIERFRNRKSAQS